MEQFKVGNRVKIKQGTRFYTGSDKSCNPMNIEGVITQIGSSGELGVYVKWDNNTNNAYAGADLELAKDNSLPPKWFIRFGPPEQAERVLAYMRKVDKKQYDGYENSGRGRCFNSDNEYWSDVYENTNYTEITFEQFEKHILKENKSTTMATTPQIKKFTIGTKDVEVTVNKGGISARGNRWSIDELRRVIEHFSRGNNTLGGYEIRSANEKLRTIRIGCTDENNVFSLEELKKVYKAYMDCQ